MIYTDLGGHSGCKILLCEPDSGDAFVRKISGEVDYNDRLKVQKQKQASFKNNLLRTPAILSSGYTKDNLYYFDMEYIQGITLTEYIKLLEIGKIRGFVKILITNTVNAQVERKSDNHAFENKILDLKTKLGNLHNPVVEEALYILENHDWSGYLPSPCHGDLTLENIIVQNNKLYLIDFLDSFYNCWILDISTLLQDVQTMWSYRTNTEINMNTIIRLIVFRDILIDTLKQSVGEQYFEVYYALLLKLIRIYPYIKDIFTYDFLNVKTQSIIDIIKLEEDKF